MLLQAKSYDIGDKKVRFYKSGTKRWCDKLVRLYKQEKIGEVRRMGNKNSIVNDGAKKGRKKKQNRIKQ